MIILAENLKQCDLILTVNYNGRQRIFCVFAVNIASYYKLNVVILDDEFRIMKCAFGPKDQVSIVWM